MISFESGRAEVYFEQLCGRGLRRISLSLDVYLFLVAESKDLEQLRCMIFEYADKENMRTRVDKAVAAKKPPA